MAQIRIDDEVYERLKRSAEVDGRSVGMQIDYLLRNRLVLEDIAEKLSAGGVSEKQNPDPQKNRGLTPIRSKGMVQSELWAAEKRLKNIVNEVQDKAVEESWTDEEAGSYAHYLEEELQMKVHRLQNELSKMEGKDETN